MDLRTIVALSILFIFRLKVEGEGLFYEYYDQSCPQVEDIVRAGLQSISLTDPTTPAALLRLMFHDCQVQGCDASILIDPANERSSLFEMTSTKNFGIRKREVITLIKSMVEAMCPQQVSCADIIILAAREAIAMSGGPQIKVPLGRKDSPVPPSYKLADTSLPPSNLGVDGMLRLFAMKGMTVEESVAIIGAHTIGVTHCFSILNRLYSSEGSIQPMFENLLKLSCPLWSLASNTSFIVNDPTTLVFDNIYYLNVLSGKGILTVDAELAADPRTSPFVEWFGADQDGFFRAFSSAFVKLSVSGVLTGRQGVVRKNCNVMN